MSDLQLINGFRNNTVVRPINEVKKDLEQLKIITNSSVDFLLKEIKKLNAYIMLLDAKTEALQKINKVEDKELQVVLNEILDEKEKAIELEEDKKHNRKVVDRESQNGDFVKIDFEGYLEDSKVPFEGGSSKNAHIELGKNMFLEDFEKQLIGVKAGEDKTIKLIFPEHYNRKDLANKQATFNIHVHCVKSSN